MNSVENPDFDKIGNSTKIFLETGSRKEETKIGLHWALFMARKWPFRKELHHPNEIFHFAAAIGREDVRGGARHHQNQYKYIGIFTHVYDDDYD